jgi:hypothetical protein
MTNVAIKCPKHGYFSQKPNDHISGCGCPSCNESKGERLIRNTLTQLAVAFETQKAFSDLMSPKGRAMYYDFFIPTMNILIEYDGRQHFEPVDMFGGDDYLTVVQLHDRLKDVYAKQNNIPLYRYPYTMSDDEIIESLKKLLTTTHENDLIISQ